MLALQRQYRQYQGWSYLLHVDNPAVLVEENPELSPLSSYTTIRRLMKHKGRVKKKPKKGKRTAGRVRAETHFEQR
ncbi:MAG: IS481 family transposase, partial [Acidobacteriota bacterium]|nr:IS481 family transposase [Acidobacteriota bacterium]